MVNVDDIAVVLLATFLKQSNLRIRKLQKSDKMDSFPFIVRSDALGASSQERWDVDWIFR